MKKKLSLYLIIVLLVVTGTLAATTSYLLKYMLEEPHLRLSLGKITSTLSKPYSMVRQPQDHPPTA